MAVLILAHNNHAPLHFFSPHNAPPPAHPTALPAPPSSLGHAQDEHKVYLLFEYVPGGELFSILKREGNLTNDHARYYAAQIASALGYLHSKSIVYRDLKPENLLLSAKGHIKLTDFGFAKVVEERTWTVRGSFQLRCGSRLFVQ